MLYFAGNLQKKVFQDLSSEYNVQLLESEMDILTANREILSMYSVMLFQDPNRSVLNSIVINPCHAFIEVEDSFQKNKELIANLDQSSRIYVNLKASTVYKLPISHILAKCLNRRMNLPDAIQHKFVTGLHEALLETVVVGCYEVDGEFTDIASFETYYSKLEERGKDPKYASRRLSISIGWTDEEILLNIKHEGQPCQMAKVEDASSLSPSVQRIEVIHNFADQVESLDGGSAVLIKFGRSL